MYSLMDQLGVDIAQICKCAGSFAEDRGMNAYIVGGIVRDVLIGTDSDDVDIMLEGDAISFCSSLINAWDRIGDLRFTLGGFSKFKKYGTAKIKFTLVDDENAVFSVDFSSARKEHYPVSGGVPKVVSGSLKDDLSRRDFAINAMAMSIMPSDFGTLVDMFDGEGDLRKGLISILHPKSFEEDPARLLRAVRFMERFGFLLSDNTDCEFKKAVDGQYLSRLSRYRLFDEFRKGLCENDPWKITERLNVEGLLKQVSLRLNPCSDSMAAKLREKREGRVVELNGNVYPFWKAVMAAMVIELSENELADMLKTFEFSKRQINSFRVICRDLLAEA